MAARIHVALHIDIDSGAAIRHHFRREDTSSGTLLVPSFHPPLFGSDGLPQGPVMAKQVDVYVIKLKRRVLYVRRIIRRGRHLLNGQ